MCALFLPFTPNGKKIELRAIEVKRHLALNPAASVDPFAVLARVPVRLVDATVLSERAPRVAHSLFVEHRHDWSAVGFGDSPEDGVPLVLLNPTHSPTRRRATLMEELVHLVLDHPKTRITVGGVVTGARSYRTDVEDEAYAVGAACLVPYPDLFHAVRDDHDSASIIAGRFGVSEECVQFRIKRAGLSKVYQKRCAGRASARARTQRHEPTP